jgi:predicted metal-dependent hydrolase
MEPAASDYDARYLGGILLFNEGDFFEAHEVWEALWLDSSGPARKFYQGLIQAAVALYHFGNGNLRGAAKLFHSSRDYLNAFGPRYLGLDLAGFAAQMDRCFAEVLAQADADRPRRPSEELIPVIALDPPPASWPDAAELKNADD